MATETKIISSGSRAGGYMREIFDSEGESGGLRVYIKHRLKIYEAVISGCATLEREAFCAGKFTFTVVKDGVIDYIEGDTVSVSYDGEVIFVGYIFTKERTKDGLIKTTAYDQLRYLKNKRTYTRGAVTLSEAVRKIADDNALRKGEIAQTTVKLSPFAAQRVSLLDVFAKGAADTLALGGGRYILYDKAGYLTLSNESEMDTDIYIAANLCEDYVYRDSIDDGVYNTVEVYYDKKKYNMRYTVTAEDSENVREWGTLTLSVSTDEPQTASVEAQMLLKKYDKVKRSVVLKGAAGRSNIFAGSRVYVSLTIGDLALEGKMRVEKAVHRFEKNVYLTDIYLDGSEIG